MNGYKFGTDCFTILVTVNEKFNAEIKNLLRGYGIADTSVCTINDWARENVVIDKLKNQIYAFMLEHDLLTWVRDAPNALTGSSFKRYVCENNMPEKIARLKRGLDSDSVEVIDTALFKALQFPEEWLSPLWRLSVPEYESIFMTEEDSRLESIFYENVAKFGTLFDLTGGGGGELGFHHGLYFANDKVKEYIAGRDFLDCGSFDGGSALVFSKLYSPRKVYSFDLSMKNGRVYEENMRRNAISADKYEFLHCGIADAEGVCTIMDSGEDSVSVSRFGTSNEQDGIRVPLISIDRFVETRYGVDVGFIKCDLEGYGLKALIGMKRTIERFRPVVCLAIYHNPDEFFEIKPLFEEYANDFDYCVQIMKLNPHCHGVSDVCLFAYPGDSSR